MKFKLANKKQRSILIDFYSGTSEYKNSMDVRKLGFKKVDLNKYLLPNIQYDKLRMTLELKVSENGLISNVFVTFESAINEKIDNEGNTKKTVELNQIDAPSLCGYSRGDMEDLKKEYNSYSIILDDT